MNTGIDGDRTYTSILREMERAVVVLQGVRVHPADEGKQAGQLLKLSEMLRELGNKGAQARHNARRVQP
jgi:hypothetical protein